RNDTVSFRVGIRCRLRGSEEVQKGKRERQGKLERKWRQTSDSLCELIFDYNAEHAYSHQGDSGLARLHRRLTVRIQNSDSPASYDEGRIEFHITLSPRKSWHSCIQLLPLIEERQASPQKLCPSFFKESSSID